MPWLPDHVWLAQKAQRKGSGKGSYGGYDGGYGGNYGGDAQALLALLMGQMGQFGGNSGGGKKRKAGAEWESPAPKQVAAAHDKTWKTILNEAYVKKHKSITKGDIVYQTDGTGPFTSIVVSENFSTTYTGEGASKKEAENAASKAAVQGEFPEAAIMTKTKAGGPIIALTGGEQVVQIAARIAKTVGWKGRLHHALAKQLQSNPTADDLAYETAKQGEGNGGWVSTLTSPHFSKEYTSGKNSSKGRAEDNVAKIAFSSEFGAIFHALPQEERSRKAAAPAAGERKKKLAELEPKNELMRGLCLLLGRPTTKEDIEVTFTEVEDQITPTLTIKMDAEVQTYTGATVSKTAPKEERKAAETVAVKAALAKNRAAFKSKFAEADAKKEQRGLEFKARIAQLQEEKKLAKLVKTEQK